MAPTPVSLLLLWGLTLAHGAFASFCAVTCSTDYIKTLNCSCSGSAPTHPVLLNVSCSDYELVVSGGCAIKPPRSWCTILQEELDDVASVGTSCVATAYLQDSRAMTQASESSSWVLADIVKPEPPFNVRVANTDKLYNVTWNNNTTHCLTYRVRVRTAGDLLQKATRMLQVEKEYLLLDRKTLQPHVNFVVDVQARMCPEYFLQGPWSEWTSSAEQRSSGAAALVEGMNIFWVYISLPIIFLLGLLLLGYLQKPCWQKKLRRITSYPRPNEFFKPLYKNHGGNFTEWVKPVFNEYDYLSINASVKMVSEKHDILHWSSEKQSYGQDVETREDGQFLCMPQHPSSLQLHLQDSGSSQGTGHSIGHISIHTVTLSGEEFEEGVGSQSSLRSYQDGESFGSFGDANRQHAGYNLEDSQVVRQSGIPPHHHNQIADDLFVENIHFQPQAQFNEPERVSLNSFVSNEQSEDGYPNVDLDTIDSGFGECGSPGVSDSNQAEQMDSFQEHKNSNSNYVKQWMICSPIQEDAVSNELHET
ncbi:interleukin 21 receptor, tandem duplicate 1 [Odontesthes bonariensis]|uniref:interleukin 21 receptor, tandem duplicate 1 n=1 Tax=Odontesthes bonariensis TaxID=219752 RepID=UPI003F589578